MDPADIAADGRLERKRLRPDGREARLCEMGRDLTARSHPSSEPWRRGTAAAGLWRSVLRAASGYGVLSATRLAQATCPYCSRPRFCRTAPRTPEGARRFHRQIHRGHAWGVPIALGRLPTMASRVIDATHAAVASPGGSAPGSRSPVRSRSENIVGRLHPEQADRPHVALAVRGPQCHLPPDEPARETATRSSLNRIAIASFCFLSHDLINSLPTWERFRPPPELMAPSSRSGPGISLL